jgi:single-stranded-DNA-specific exonuclease
VSLLLPPRVIKDKHVKLRVKQKLNGFKDSFNYEAVGWRMAERIAAENLQPGDQLDLVFKVAMNFHPDFGGLELMLEDLRKSAPVAIPVYSQ